MKEKEFMKKAKEFKKLFGFEPPISQFLFECGEWSIDTVTLEEMIPIKDVTISLKTVVEEKFGKRAAELVQEMI